MSTAIEHAWCVRVPHRPRAARLARSRLLATLTGLVSRERLADALAIVAELVGNAVRHAAPLPGGMIRVGWRVLTGGGLLIQVTDGGGTSSAPRVKPPSADAGAGRGLAIVAALTSRWGVEQHELGQCVWAELS